MIDSTKNALWQVSLSNGQTFFEGKGDFTEIKSALSPWQRLLKYMSVNNAQITSLSLYTRDGRTFNLPSVGKNPKFRPFAVAEKPIDYMLERYYGQDMDITGKGIGPSDHFTTISAVYADYRLQLWVDENNTRNSWVLVVKV